MCELIHTADTIFGVNIPATPTPVVARRNSVARLVGERGHVVIADLAAELGVSEMTVRRDVAHLAAEQRVIPFHGGVRSPQPDMLAGSLGVRLGKEAITKTRIAQRAAELVSDGDVIAIDAGSTAAKLAQQLTGRAGLRVVTASVPVITAFLDADAVELIALGGALRRETQSFTGPSVVAAALELQVETYFLGAAALSPRGAFDVTDIDAVVKREFARVATRVISLADSTKFAKRAMSRICGWDAIDVLITDDRIDEESLAMLRGNDVDVILVAAGRH